MNLEAIARAVTGLREVRDLLDSFDGQHDIHRAAELEGAAEKVASCAADLVDVEMPDDLQSRLAYTVKALKAAEKAAHAHRRDPLAHPLSPTRFALKTGSARGSLQGTLEILDPAHTPPSAP
jgi:hypothetical protein